MPHSHFRAGPCKGGEREGERELKQWKTSEASGESRFAEGFQDLLVVSLVPRHLWHRSTERSVPSLCNQQAPSDQRGGGGVYSPEEEEELRVETLTFLFRSSFPLLVLPLPPFEFPSDPLSSLFEEKGDTCCSKGKKADGALAAADVRGIDSRNLS